jgi:hypothetical protein
MAVQDEILNLIPIAFSVAIVGKAMELTSKTMKKGKGISWW